MENYRIENNGLIHQINIKKIHYDVDYINNRYNCYKDLVEKMSYLRYGYLIGTIKNIPDSILDVGYGNGNFLEICSKTIKNCYGSDISGYPVLDNIKKINYEQIFNYKFDVICFFDSLEHFDDIYFLKKLNCNYIYISVPECHNFSDEWFDKWKHRRENEHLWHFNKSSMKNFMNEQGYDLISFSNMEDIIRKPIDENGNILTGIFKKNKTFSYNKKTD
jgi:SAM-dependent methyltransferase